MRKTFLILITLILAVPGAALAQSRAVTAFGPHIGFSVGPDQLVLGAHMLVGEVAPAIAFVPNVDLGLGDDQTVFALNMDLHYHFEIRETDWRPYFGAGVGIHFFDRDIPGSVRDDSRTEVGGSFIFGAGIPTRAGNQFFGEIKLGLGDIPDLKILAGWNFGT